MKARFFHHQCDRSPPKKDYRHYRPWYVHIINWSRSGLALSILLHLTLMTALVTFETPQTKPPQAERVRLKFKPITKPKLAKPLLPNKEIIVEKIPLPENKSPAIPPQAKWSHQNHRAKRETRIQEGPPKHKNLVPPDADPIKGAVNPNLKKSLASGPTSPPAPPKQAVQDRRLSPPKKGRLQVQTSPFTPLRTLDTPRNKYEQLLSDSQRLASAQVSQGYQNYLSQDLPISNAIDINTQEFRYIGYFAGLKKAIELAWNYPSHALRKGWDGNVFVHFIINQKGNLTRAIVLDSSGHHILDQAIIEAIQLAAPYAPLPEAFGPQLSIKGTFRYVLH
ncbi:MAG: TonB family protein [Zetaproteobacteria bacterium]|nr:TonB family protein [Zetaproteobacteria bacterium]